MQTCLVTGLDGPPISFEIPDEECELMPGVPWGRPSWFFTPAYWKSRALAYERLGTYEVVAGTRPLLDEWAYCLLGGHGLQAEVGWAAADRVIGSGLLRRDAPAADYEALLREPFQVGGWRRRYRFPAAKARYLAAGATWLRQFAHARLSDRELRDALTQLPGVGLKTASWIVRNLRGSDSVAIIDVHITRVGKWMGLFAEHLLPCRDYAWMEERFLAFAGTLGVRASMLDLLMWNLYRNLR